MLCSFILYKFYKRKNFKSSLSLSDKYIFVAFSRYCCFFLFLRNFATKLGVYFYTSLEMSLNTHYKTHFIYLLLSKNLQTMEIYADRRLGTLWLFCLFYYTSYHFIKYKNMETVGLHKNFEIILKRISVKLHFSTFLSFFTSSAISTWETRPTVKPWITSITF